MKQLVFCIETEDSVDMSKIVKEVNKVFTTIPGVKSVSLADQSEIDLTREKRLVLTNPSNRSNII